MATFFSGSVTVNPFVPITPFLTLLSAIIDTKGKPDSMSSHKF